MTPSQKTTELLDRFIRKQLKPQDAVVLNARLLIDPVLQQDLFYQRILHRLMGLYHREQQKKKIDAIANRLFTHPSHTSFQQTVQHLLQSTSSPQSPQS